MVDRKTRCILGWAVVRVRTQEAIQDVVDQRRKRNSTILMGLMPTNGFDITFADMKFQRARPILILSKPITPNFVIIWLALLANHVVFLGVLMLLNAHYAYLFLLSTAGNFISNAFQTMLHTLWTSLAHDI